MTMSPSSAQSVTLFERVRPPETAGVRYRKMFGCPCCFVNEQMFMGLYQDRLFLRLSSEDRTEFLALPDADLFAPLPGRVMREYVMAPPAMLTDGAELQGWVERSLTYAAALPAKQPKPRAAKRTKRAVA